MVCFVSYGVILCQILLLFFIFQLYSSSFLLFYAALSHSLISTVCYSFSFFLTYLLVILVQSESLQREIRDLQSEFEFDRIDYLDTIRKQEQEMQWLQAFVERVHPLIRRDCNYVNQERIRAQSIWDENNQCWTLPKLTFEKTQLPPARTFILYQKNRIFVTFSSNFNNAHLCQQILPTV